MLIAIEGVVAALAAIGDVNIGPAILIEIDDRHGRAHRRDLRHDVLELAIEMRRGVMEIDAGGLGDFLELEAIAAEDARFRHRRLVVRRDSLDDQRRGQQPCK